MQTRKVASVANKRNKKGVSGIPPPNVQASVELCVSLGVATGIWNTVIVCCQWSPGL